MKNCFYSFRNELRFPNGNPDIHKYINTCFLINENEMIKDKKNDNINLYEIYKLNTMKSNKQNVGATKCNIMLNKIK